MYRVTSQRRSRNIKAWRGLGWLCISCEAIFDVQWRVEDEERPDDVPHCPFCNASNSLVEMQRVDDSPDGIYTAEVKE